MFMELGIKLDNLIEDIKLWNTQRIWYKPIAYLKIKKWIKAKKFNGNNHFNIFMNTTKKNKQIWNWQYDKLIEIYVRTIMY